ncbi:hypothetical protein D3C80_1615330 [compost metagenome]
MPHCQAHPQSCQGAGLGQGLGHQQVRVAIHQTDGGLATEVDVGLIHQHHRIWIGLEQTLDCLKRQQATGRGIGVGEDDAAVRARVILDADLELLVQRQRLERNAV